jgi:hypothetical protein
MANPQIPDHFTIQYETNWQHLLQQMESRLKEKTKFVSAQGAAVRFNQFGTVSMSPKGTRNPATPLTDIAMPTRWAYPTPYDIATVFDEWDNLFLGSIVLPTSECMQSQAAAYGRTADQILINGLLGPATVTTPTTGGITPTTSQVNLAAANQVAVNYVPSGGTAANSSLTIAKLRLAKQKLDAAEASAEDRILVLSAKELSDLLGTTEVTNSLYNSVKALVDGQVDSFLGFKVIRTELLPVDNNGIRSVIAYQKNAAVLVDGGRKTFMDVLPTLSHSLQVRSTAVLGATRLLENGVVQIFCDTSK